MNFGLIGGDRRQAELASLLAAEGKEVCTYGLEPWNAVGTTDLSRAAAADVVILPLPLCRDNGVLNCEMARISTEELFCKLRPEQIVLAGQVKPAQQQEAEKNGLRLMDYFQREELAVANAAATAEAALQVAMEHMDQTLLGAECLVLGFGRIGKLLSFRLHGLGARVTAAARKPEDLAWIRAYGWKTVEINALEDALPQCDVVFNTVPTLVLDALRVNCLPRHCVCVDLASVQGVDPAAAEQRGLTAVWARALPGRLVPRTAAADIRDTIDSMLSIKE